MIASQRDVDRANRRLAHIRQQATLAKHRDSPWFASLVERALPFSPDDAIPAVGLPYGDGFILVEPPSDRELVEWLASSPALTAPELHQALKVADRDKLRGALDLGLRRRVGQRLDGRAETVFVHLAARVGMPSDLRVCEVCALVFKAPRARRCAECRHSMPRVPDLPGAIVVAGDRAAEGRAGQTQYQFTCAEPGCEQLVWTTDSRRLYCDDHATGAARVRRLRAGRA